MSPVSAVEPPAHLRQQSTSSAGEGAALVERCVVMTRRGGGYGLTVSGGYPVYVDSVRIGGPAHQAGVREGDRILKVNGMPVTTSNLQEVLTMIAGSVRTCTIANDFLLIGAYIGGQTVALSLHSPSFFCSPPVLSGRSADGSTKQNGQRAQNGHHKRFSSELPVAREDAEGHIREVLFRNISLQYCEERSS